MDYIQSLNESINYIENHILDNISTIDVADHVFMSSYHFQRIFTLLTGITVGEYIRNRRLSLATSDLINTNDSIINIAYKYGYDTPESFSKAFKRFQGVTPICARNKQSNLKSYSRLHIKIIFQGAKNMNYQIKKMDELQVVVKVKTFNIENSFNEIPKFWDEYYQSGDFKKVCSQIGICFPNEKNNPNFKYGIGAFSTLVKNVPEGFEIVTIPSGTWAIFECVGPAQKAINQKMKEIYEEWLPSSGYKQVGGYDIELYTEGDVSKDDYHSQIWMLVEQSN